MRSPRISRIIATLSPCIWRTTILSGHTVRFGFLQPWKQGLKRDCGVLRSFLGRWSEHVYCWISVLPVVRQVFHIPSTTMEELKALIESRIPIRVLLDSLCSSSETVQQIAQRLQRELGRIEYEMSLYAEDSEIWGQLFAAQQALAWINEPRISTPIQTIIQRGILSPQD